MDENNDSGVSGLSAQVEKLNQLMHVVVVILIVMTATLLVTVGGIVYEAYENQAAAYQNLEEKVNSLVPTTIQAPKP